MRHIKRIGPFLIRLMPVRGFSLAPFLSSPALISEVSALLQALVHPLCVFPAGTAEYQ